MKSKLKSAKRGRSLPAAPPNAKAEKPVELHLIITRQTGDTERYLLGTCNSLFTAYAYRRRLAAVKVPRMPLPNYGRKVKVA